MSGECGWAVEAKGILGLDIGAWKLKETRFGGVQIRRSKMLVVDRQLSFR